MCQTRISITLLFSAVCGLAAQVPYQYVFVSDTKTFSEAQSYCRQTYTDLATVNNMDDMDMLSDILKDKYKGNSGNPSNYAFIGLQKVDAWKWQWSLPREPFFLDNDTYQNWAAGEPSNAVGSDDCGAINKYSALWFDDSCDQDYSFLCYKENEYIWLYNIPKNWREAQSYCRKYHTDVYSVYSNDAKMNINGLLAQSLTERVWMGLFKDSWKWTDDTNSSFRYWSSNQPDNSGGNERCVAVYMGDNRWSDLPCDLKRPFVCQENKLILINQNLTWREALTYCTENHVDLVSVNSAEIQDWLMKVAQKASSSHVWMGMSYTYSLGFWYWVNREDFDYQYWAPGYGAKQENCSLAKLKGAVQSGGNQQWVSLPETERLNFICSNY